MQCFVKGKKIRYNPYHMRNAVRLDRGDSSETAVYLEDGKVIKFNKIYGNSELTKKDGLFYTTISTDWILLPNDIILDKKRKIKGSICNTYVPDLGIESMTPMMSDTFLEKIFGMKKDKEKITDQNILLRDLFGNNISYNNGIYIIDYGRHQHENNPYNILQTESENKDSLNELIIGCFLYQLIKQQLIKEKMNIIIANKVTRKFRAEMNDIGCDAFEYFEKDMKQEDLSSYRKRKIKEISLK